MRDRLEILRNLLSVDGSIFVQIDDVEQAYLRIVLDEIFGRNNFINTISVNMKNVAGASGGGQDKKLKKNIEYVHVYAKDYSQLASFQGVYDYIPIEELVKDYKKEGKSWKYTTILIYKGDKKYIGSTVDGDENEIKIYSRKNYIIKSINQIMKEERISEVEVYKKYAKNIFQTAMPQSSIRPRVMKKVNEIGDKANFYSIEYIPKTGKNKCKVYEQFYKGDKFRLLAWLKDVSEERDGALCKKELQGTYWNFANQTKNLTKEGNVSFPNGKKPESLVSRIIKMATIPGDLVLDSFAGSGTTGAVAHKMGRKWIMVEFGEHCHTHIIPRLKKVIDGEDQGGISKAVDWKGGGGFRYYKLASSLINKDSYGREIISPKYNPEMLAEAMCKLMGYIYSPDEEVYWKHGYANEKSFIFVSTQSLDEYALNALSQEIGEEMSLMICCPAYWGDVKKYPNLILEKIPEAVLQKCEYGKDDYRLPVIEETHEDEVEIDD